MLTMDLAMTVLLLVAVWVFQIVIRAAIRRARFLRKMNVLHGPQGLPVLGSALDWMVPINRLQSKMQEYFQQYESPSKIWLGPFAHIVITKPQHAEPILGNPRHNDKSLHYTFLEPWLGTGLLTSKGRKWHTHRKMITPTFHFKILDNFVEVFSEKSEILVKKLEKAGGGNSFDVYPYITKCALDIICETAMGTQMDVQLQQVDSDYVKAIYNVTETTMQRILSPWLYPDIFFNWSSIGRRYHRSLSFLHNFTNRVIREKKQLLQVKQKTDSSDEDVYLGLRKRRKAFLDMLLEAEEHGYQLTDEELREEVDTFMFEGHDTTTAAMCWALQLLGSHPDVQNKVHEEQDGIFQGSARSATMKDLNDMKYLELVIKETLRLYPSVPMVGRTLTEEVQIGEHKVPPGVTAVISIYFIHRDEEHFPDPLKFDPERFLPEKVATRHPYAFIPFSAGPRNCIGQKFALLEEKTVLSYIMRNYTVRAEKENLVALPELILRAEHGVPLKLYPRKLVQ